MAISVKTYPVKEELGKTLNVLPGFQPIRIEFVKLPTDTDIIGVECEIVDPVTENDILGFSLYADFSPSNIAIVDTSIINDKSNQEILFKTDSLINAKQTYLVKYRDVNVDGTEGSYILINETDIIAIYALEQSNPETLLNKAENPPIYLGYNNVLGGVFSQENTTSDLIISMLKKDIQEAPIGAEVDLYTYIKDGLVALNYPTEGSGGITTVPNSGAGDETDWIDTTGNGVADDWLADPDATCSIVSGNGFAGAAQRIFNGDTNLVTLVFFNNVPITANQKLLRFKYRSFGSVQIRTDTGVFENIPANTGSAIETSFTVNVVTEDTMDIAFVLNANGDWLEIDEVEFVEIVAAIDLSDAYSVDVKLKDTGSTFDTKNYLIETPDSDSNILFEEYEFMLGWYNREGAPVQWLFTDWETQDRVRAIPVNLKDPERIESILQSENVAINLVAEDLTRGELDLVKSALVAKTLYRIYRTDSQLFEPGGFKRYAIESNSINIQQSEQRYSIRFTIRENEPALWR